MIVCPWIENVQFMHVMQVVGILFEVHYWTLSGSMQTALLRLTDTAKDIGNSLFIYLFIPPTFHSLLRVTMYAATFCLPYSFVCAAIESKQHTGLILRLIDKQRDTLERG